MVTALQSDSGAIILFDFASAFPSLPQDCLPDMLRHLELPVSAQSFVKHLYDNSRCQIASQGETLPGFPLTAG
eukprot:8850598-Pyramimonas_sp.AAC.1